MNIEESSHSTVQKAGATFVEIPPQISSSTRSYEQTFNSVMYDTNSTFPQVFNIPMMQVLGNIEIGTANNQRIGQTIQIHRFEVIMNITTLSNSTVGNHWEPFSYFNPATMLTDDDYFRYKLIDPRVRIMAVTPKRKMQYLPDYETFPYYIDGNSPGNLIPPIKPNDHPGDGGMTKQLDARSWITHYDDVKNLYNRSSEVPNLTWYQDIHVGKEYEFDDDPNALQRFGDNELFQRVPFIWVYWAKQPRPNNECALKVNMSVRILYDCK